MSLFLSSCAHPPPFCLGKRCPGCGCVHGDDDDDNDEDEVYQDGSTMQFPEQGTLSGSWEFPEAVGLAADSMDKQAWLGVTTVFSQFFSSV